MMKPRTDLHQRALAVGTNDAELLVKHLALQGVRLLPGSSDFCARSAPIQHVQRVQAEEHDCAELQVTDGGLLAHLRAAMGRGRPSVQGPPIGPPRSSSGH